MFSTVLSKELLLRCLEIVTSIVTIEKLSHFIQSKSLSFSKLNLSLQYFPQVMKCGPVSVRAVALQEPESYSCRPATLNCKSQGAANRVIELLGEIWWKLVGWC